MRSCDEKHCLPRINAKQRTLLRFAIASLLAIAGCKSKSGQQSEVETPEDRALSTASALGADGLAQSQSTTDLISINLDEPGDPVDPPTDRTPLVVDTPMAVGEPGPDGESEPTDGEADTGEPDQVDQYAYDIDSLTKPFEEQIGTLSPGPEGTFSVANNGELVEIAAHMWLPTNSTAGVHIPVVGDFDGDGQPDPTVYGITNGHWYILGSRGQAMDIPFGRANTDIPIAADYDGDGVTDIAVWRSQLLQWTDPVSRVTYNWGGNFTYRSSRTGQHIAFPPNEVLLTPGCRTLGPTCPFLPGDVPVTGNFNGSFGTPRSPRWNFAVFRPPTSQWIWLSSSNTIVTVTYGMYRDIPAPADYDGDGITDLAVYRPSTGEFWIHQSSNGADVRLTIDGLGTFGYGDTPVPADYDGDGKADMALFRPSSSTYYIRRSSNGTSYAQQMGGPQTAIPVPAKWDRDNKADLAVYHPDSGNWYYRMTNANPVPPYNWFFNPPPPLHDVGPLGWGAATPRPVVLCPGVVVDSGGYYGAARGLEKCAGFTPPDGALTIPPVSYKINYKVTLPNPIVLQSAGGAPCWSGAGIPASANPPGYCAWLIADPNLYAPGMLYAGPLLINNTQPAAPWAERVKLRRLVADGNRQNRLGSLGAVECRNAVTNGHGPNLVAYVLNGEFSNSVTMSAVCGTGFAFSGHNPQVLFNLVKDNGDHYTENMWSDGITMLVGADSILTGAVYGNMFVNNSDVDFIMFRGPNMRVEANQIHQTVGSFAGIMLDNLASDEGDKGNFIGALVVANSIFGSPAHNIHFGIELGPSPWYLGPSIFGGTVRNNYIDGAKQGINIDGAGTHPNRPGIIVHSNTIVNNLTGVQAFHHGCLHATSAINIHFPEHAGVCWNETCTVGPPPGTTNSAWHGCP